ncbi:MAG TPA: hypothetical protein VHR47_09360 [Bacillota bacterium]|nr:hypothetical protein [Bacillota bacterium]
MKSNERVELCGGRRICKWLTEHNCDFFHRRKKSPKKVAGTWRFPEFPSSLKAVLKRPTVHEFENRGNVDALHAAYSLHGPPGRDFTV